jgi:hypothetical protein
MLLDDRSRPDANAPFDDAVGADFHVVGQFAVGVNKGRRMDEWHQGVTLF